jgi:hypothetical protein
MKLSKILATSTIIGLTSTAALADNQINFSQSTGDVNSVAFTQTGGGNNSIGSNATPSTVIGSLETLSIEQNGGGDNTADFAITTPTETTNNTSDGSVQILTTGDGNTSDLTVTQSGAEKLAFAVAVLGDDNSVTATIDGVSSVVNLQSDGNNVAYNFSQTGAAEDTAYEHSITANVSKTGDAAATVDLIQTGTTNTITLGAPSDVFGDFDGTNGTVGLTLLGEADVDITQSAAIASYVTTQTVPAGGSLTVLQSD